MTNNPFLAIKEISDPYVRSNFQNLKAYFESQNQLYGFQFVEVIFTGAEENRRVRHSIGGIPRDLVRLEVSGPGVVTFHRDLFDENFIYLSADDEVRVRFFVGRYHGSAIGPNTDENANEEWSAELPESQESSGTGLPEGGDAGNFLQKDSADDGDASWVSGAFSGYSSRFSEQFDTDNLRETLLQILDFSYLAPQISLTSSVSTAVREKGTSVSPVPLTAATTKRSDDITSVTFYKNGVLVNTVASPNPDGGNESYTDVAGFSDTTTYFARVSDGTTEVQSSTLTFTEVYPYYYGVGAPGLTAAQVAALTKSVMAESTDVSFDFSPSSQVYYFAYPAAYGTLTSILDDNGFETISDWTLRVENITGLDGNPVSYNIYEFNNLTTQTNFTNRFRQ
jgi:hypothetical protein